MEHKPRLEFRTPEITYEGSLKRPMLRLLTAGSGILDSFLVGMEPFGGTLQSLRVETPAQELWRSFVAVSVFGGFGQAWIGASALGLQLGRFPAPVDPKAFSGVIIALLAAIERSGDDVELAEHSFSFTFHGRLEGTTPEEFLARYVNPPPASLGTLITSSVGYNLGGNGQRERLELRLEPSASVRPGLFVTAKMSLSSKVPAPEAPGVALEQTKAILSHDSFPLEVEWLQAGPPDSLTSLASAASP